MLRKNKMIKYRPQRGGLEESLAESKEFNSIEDTLNYILRENRYPRQETNVGLLRVFSITYYGYDDRCKQELHMVCYKASPMGFIFEEKE
jgi:hypothetical protein